jgi:hypothetical protein
LTRRRTAFLHYEQVYIRPQDRGSGKGVQMMARAVEAAHQAGLPVVHLDAVGSAEYHPEENGYYTWPRIASMRPWGAGRSGPRSISRHARCPS